MGLYKKKDCGYHINPTLTDNEKRKLIYVIDFLKKEKKCPKNKAIKFLLFAGMEDYIKLYKLENIIKEIDELCGEDKDAKL